jgi:hypothetical protein
MLGSRRGLHVAMLENYELEIKGELEGKLDSEVNARTVDSRFSSGSGELEVCRYTI